MLTRLYNFLNSHCVLITFVVLVPSMIIFYPTGYVSIDEYDYFRNATQLSSGNLRQECDPKIPSQFPVNQGSSVYCISKYNLGTSAFFTSVTSRPELTFVVTFLAFLAAILVFNSTLKLLEIPTIFTLLYAFFPSFVYFSRTQFSEIFSALLILLTFHALIRFNRTAKAYWGILAGVFMGAAVLVRYTNALTLLPLLVFMTVIPGTSITDFIRYNITLAASGILGKLMRTFKVLWLQTAKLLWPIIGGLPLLVLFLWLNNYLYGAFIRSGYYYSQEEGVFIFSQVPSMLLRFVGALAVIYPGMIFIALLGRSRYRFAVGTAVGLTLIFYSGFQSILFEGRILDLVLGIRFVVPLVPLLLVLYADALQHIVRQFAWAKVALILGLAMCALAVPILSAVHLGFLSERGVSWPQIPHLESSTR